MKIEAGKFYKTRNDRKAFVLGIYPPDIMDGSAAGAIQITSGEWDGAGWFADGCVSKAGEIDDEDLIAEWVEPVSAELFLYRFPNGEIRCETNKYSMVSGNPDIIGRKSVTVAEGEGIE